MLDGAKTSEEFEQKFNEMWDAQKLDYPTVTRNEVGEWNYFDVTPEHGQLQYFRKGKPRREDYIDGVDDTEMQWSQGEGLARETLELAGRYYEADSCTLDSIVGRAFEIANGKPDQHPAYFVAVAFISEVLDCAIKGAAKRR
jgi:hypothetical protein